MTHIIQLNNMLECSLQCLWQENFMFIMVIPINNHSSIVYNSCPSCGIVFKWNIYKRAGLHTIDVHGLREE